MKYNILRKVNLSILKGALVVLICVSLTLPVVSLDTQVLFLLLASMLVFYIEDSWEYSWNTDTTLNKVANIINADSNKIEKVFIYESVGNEYLGVTVTYRNTRSNRFIFKERHGGNLVRALRDRHYIVDVLYTPSVFTRAFYSDGLIVAYLILTIMAIASVLPLYTLSMAFIHGNNTLSTVNIFIGAAGLALAAYTCYRCMKMDFNSIIERFIR